MRVARMKRVHCYFFFSILLIAFIVFATEGFASPSGDSGSGRFTRLVWAEEFNGTEIDLATWGYDTEENGWSHKWNNELQQYVDDGRGGNNAYLRDGCLVIKAVKVNDANEFGSYKSARLNTKSHKSFTYGRVAARMKLPFGQGVWPAFWMLGDDISSIPWPRCGEIDIMELVGGDGAAGKNDRTAHGTVHGDGYSGDKGITGRYELKNGKKFCDEFHTFEVEWDEKGITWLVDGAPYHRVLKKDVNAFKDAIWDFDHPFFIIVNLAIGGGWPGKPDSSTSFPQYFYIDWIRVYQ